MRFPLSNFKSGLWWLQWVAILIAVGLFAAFSLLITLLVPSAEHFWDKSPAGEHLGEKALVWINGIAAALAISIAPYLMRAFDRMHRQADQQNKELHSLHAIDRAINAQLDLDALLQIAVREATLAVDAELGALYLWREGRTVQVEARAFYGISPAMQTLLSELLDDRARTLARAAPDDRNLVSLDTTWQTDRLNSSLKLRSLIAVPVPVQNQPGGLFLIGNRGEALAPGEGFLEEDERLLADIAGTVTVAVQNARFVRETRRRGEMLRALVAHTGEAIAASSDASGLMQLFVQAAARILGCPRVAVYSHDADNHLFVPLAAIDQRTDQGQSLLPRFHSQMLPAQFVLLGLRADGKPDTEPHVYAQAQAALLLTPGSGDFLAGPGVVFVLCARDRRVLGLLCLGDMPPGQEVAEFAQALAAQAAVTLENAQLFSELETLYQREKRIAGELQKNLLPVIPGRVGEFEFAHEYQAALEEAQVGGDFLDHFALDGTRVGFVMADVSGKGLKAAMQTAAVKYTLRAFAHDMPRQPGRVLAHVNNVMCAEANLTDGFVTLFFGVLDTRTGELIYTIAGHEPPLCRRADGTTFALDGTDGMVLGCLPGLDYGEGTLTLAPGDFLLLYTDGVTESRAAQDGDFLGIDGLSRVLPSSGTPAPDALASLYARLRAFAGNVRRDDLALLLIRHAPAVPSPTADGTN